ncbi:MAG: hypothetical protein ACREMX_01450 [Gemmatimonadales bacterium]
MNADRTAETDLNALGSQPRWVLGGKYILLERGGMPDQDIFIMKADGTGQ